MNHKLCILVLVNQVLLHICIFNIFLSYFEYAVDLAQVDFPLAIQSVNVDFFAVHQE